MTPAPRDAGRSAETSIGPSDISDACSVCPHTHRHQAPGDVLRPVIRPRWSSTAAYLAAHARGPAPAAKLRQDYRTVFVHTAGQVPEIYPDQCRGRLHPCRSPPSACHRKRPGRPHRRPPHRPDYRDPPAPHTVRRPAGTTSQRDPAPELLPEHPAPEAFDAVLAFPAVPAIPAEHLRLWADVEG